MVTACIYPLYNTFKTFSTYVKQNVAAIEIASNMKYLLKVAVYTLSGLLSVTKMTETCCVFIKMSPKYIWLARSLPEFSLPLNMVVSGAIARKGDTIGMFRSAMHILLQNTQKWNRHTQKRFLKSWRTLS